MTHEKSAIAQANMTPANMNPANSHQAGIDQSDIAPASNTPADGAAAGGQPEALATFAATARNDGRKPDSIGLHATAETQALPADSALKDEAATRLLRKGLSGEDEGAREALDALPDRTRDTSGDRA